MNSKVKVMAADATGSVISKSENNKDYGYIRLEQTRLVINENTNFMEPKTLSVLIHGTIDNLKKAGYYAGQELPGVIVVKESTEPFNKINPERDLKVAGNTGIVCTVNGQPIYRKTVYSQTSSSEDVLVKHDNTEQLRAAYEAGSKSKAIQANTDFDAI
jgi:hypothetical protein